MKESLAKRGSMGVMFGNDMETSYRIIVERRA